MSYKYEYRNEEIFNEDEDGADFRLVVISVENIGIDILLSINKTKIFLNVNYLKKEGLLDVQKQFTNNQKIPKIIYEKKEFNINKTINVNFSDNGNYEFEIQTNTPEPRKIKINLTYKELAFILKALLNCIE